jgi:UDP-glucuronate 4-epimerase
MVSTKNVLVTGAAGFIGFHLCKRLVGDGYSVTGIDNMNTYYDVQLKQSRLDILLNLPGFRFEAIDLCDKKNIDRLFSENNFNYVVNLAAQAGVRYSLINPYAYLESNLHGFLNILEACRHARIEHLVYASSSSVYGGNTKMPFSVHDNVDHPISLYAASKKSNELMAHTYSALYRLPVTGLRFFTVYGPYGRPDMALFLFTKAILEGKAIEVYNNGKMKRDFTYIDDIVEGMVRLLPRIPAPDPSWSGQQADPAVSFAPYRLYNIGNHQPVELMHFIDVLEQKLQRKAVKSFLPMQDGDVPETFADVDDLMRDTGFKPKTTIEEGIGKFVAWYKEYYNIK